MSRGNTFAALFDLVNRWVVGNIMHKQVLIVTHTDVIVRHKMLPLPSLMQFQIL